MLYHAVNVSAGACPTIMTTFLGMGFSIIRIRRSWDRLIFIMGIRYGGFDYGDKMAVIYIYIHIYIYNGKSYAGKTTGLYWDGAKIVVHSRNAYTHILQEYCAILGWSYIGPRASEITMQDMGKIGQYQITWHRGAHYCYDALYRVNGT